MSVEIDWALTEKEIEVALEIREPEWLLAHLLINSVVFLNTNWNQTDWPEEAKQGIVVLVNCNDSFGPYADCERLQHADLVLLYRLWRRDPIYGPLAWCIAQRKTPPWRARERMQEAGWDVDALVRGELPIVETVS